MSAVEAAELQEHLLEWLISAAQETMPAELLGRVHARVIPGIIGGDLTLQLYTYLLAERVLTESREVPFRTMVEAPERWRDRLGLLFGKRRLLASGTVTIRADYYQSFPESKIKYPLLGAPVPIVRLEQEDPDVDEGE
jgi:hypothetical protein